MNKMGPIMNTRIISKFPSISHLTGSKMIDDNDKLIGKDMEEFFIKKKKFDFDTIYVTEKLDGSNVSVYKKDGLLYPVNRRGIDIRRPLKTHDDNE